MLKVYQAIELILSRTKTLGKEKVELLSSLDRTLAEDIYSDIRIPPFDFSALDGYVVVSSDVKGAYQEYPKTLRVIGELPAGSISPQTLSSGQAIKIMTGAPIPEGADAVVGVENTEAEGEMVRIFKEVGPGSNIHYTGESVEIGEKVLAEGDIIGAAEIGMLASLGRGEVEVIRRPKVVVIATGDELVEIDEELSPGKIRGSNSYSLTALLLKYGGLPIWLGMVSDDKDKLREKIEENLDQADMIITSGGVSMGEYDIVKDVLKEMGEMLYWGVAMRPGTMNAFGTIGDKLFFGLPGNPASSMISFLQFVRPAIMKMSGLPPRPLPEVQAVLDEEVRVRKEYRYFVRVHLRQSGSIYHASQKGPRGAGILKSMVMADGLLVVPEDVDFIPAHEMARIQLIR